MPRLQKEEEGHPPPNPVPTLGESTRVADVWPSSIMTWTEGLEKGFDKDEE